MTAQEFMQEWEKKNNPFYPSEMRWDRININKMLFEYDESVKNNIVLPLVIKSVCENCKEPVNMTIEYRCDNCKTTVISEKTVL